MAQFSVRFNIYFCVFSEDPKLCANQLFTFTHILILLMYGNILSDDQEILWPKLD